MRRFTPEKIAQMAKWFIESRNERLESMKESGIEEVAIWPTSREKANCICCDAVWEHAGVIYPIKDVPKLPLANCDKPWCPCDYQGVFDF